MGLKGLFTRTFFRFYRIGIVKETKNRWECRSPLAPRNIENLKSKWGSDLELVIQPSRKRIFSDDEYSKVGVLVKDDLTECDLILGVKEVPIDLLIPNKSYIFFSHTHKGQVHNQPLLRAICAKWITLYDYELIKDPHSQQRLVAFGKYAGYAGILNAMNGLGDYLLSRGIRTPFINIPLAHRYRNLGHVHEAMESFGHYLKEKRISKDANPIVFTFTGMGNVTKGALEIIKHLPHEYLDAKDLKSKVLDGNLSRDRVYICLASPRDFLKRKDGKGMKFDYQRYLSHPEEYESEFCERIAPFSSVLVNGIYWGPKYPRLITKEDLKVIKKDPQNRLSVIADISCDLEGSLEFVKEASTIDEPFYYYESRNEIYTWNRAEAQKWKADHVQIMSIDNLPTQLPEDSSIHFGNCLEPLIPVFAGLTDNNRELIEKCKITDKGEIVERFSHLRAASIKKSRRVLILGNGYVVAPVIDFLKVNQKSFDIGITVASNDIEESDSEGVKRVKIDVCKDSKYLSNLIQESDIVISLVSADLHVEIAKICIEKGKNMVTASYISEGMKSLNSAAESANVLILNEIGLDPGLDHLVAMKIIDECKDRGEEIESFVSWCGGLPAPETLLRDPEKDNLLNYKFSWSPRGVLAAIKNPAKYLKNGQIIKVPESVLLKSAALIEDLDAVMKFEGIPNRDSLKYVEMYGLKDSELKTMFRGTLRFKGFFEAMQQFKELGFLDESNDISERKFGSGIDFIDLVTGEVENDSSALKWLKKHCGSINLSNQVFKSIIEGFSFLLNDALQYGKGEHDMVFLHHTIISKTRRGDSRKITASLCVFGDEKYSGMARTVGIPVALAALKILEKDISGNGVKGPLERAIYEPLLKNLPFKFIITIKD